ncbi:MAG TPA: DUF1622 domain-containing protein [Nitrososphaeraceae archaeon]|nr:DUF1622 domain-containing protein [Nitrososphaeraceae archaeon]
METPELYHIIIEYIVIIIEIIVGILVSAIVIISIANLVRLLLSKLRKDQRQVYVRNIVARMLRGLLIALDFLIAADLLQTILDPTLEETAVLALIVVLRILLSWSLSKEIEIGAKEESNTNKRDI